MIVRQVSPGAGRESMVGRVCVTGRFGAGSERLTGIMDSESGGDMMSAEREESLEVEKL